MSGRLKPAPEKKEAISWPVGGPVRQSEYGCNSAAIVSYLLTTGPNRMPRFVTVDYADKHWLEPVRTPHGSVFKDVLEQAKEEGDIKSTGYVIEPSIKQLKQALRGGPIILSHDWYASMFSRVNHGVITVAPTEQEKKADKEGKLVGHTWVCYGYNPNNGLFWCISQWGDLTPYKIPIEAMQFLMNSDGEMAQPTV